MSDPTEERFWPTCFELVTELRQQAGLPPLPDPYEGSAMDLRQAWREALQKRSLSRLTVVDHSTGGEGRVFEKWDIAISLAVQDDGRTLKVFVTDPQP